MREKLTGRPRSTEINSGITSNPYEFISQVCSSLDDMGLVMSSPRYKK
ncbi:MULTISPECIES: hypothetical protein [Priestia]|nr:MULTISPECIES: hypothetical protein [Priestia]